MKLMLSLAAVSMKTALKYRRNWNKNSAAVKALQKMMPTGAKKGYRLNIPIGAPVKHHFVIPPAVRFALKKAGFIATDYLAKKCVKITDVEQKNEFNIGKVIGKDEHAKMAFDNDPQLQNSTASEFTLVVSCHPYDVIGMSTGRDWDKQSCMRLDDGVVNRNDKGAYSSTVAHDVAEGTLVAYAIKTGDTNISKPLGRCLVKPFRNSEGEVLYRRETKIYGNPVPGFSQALNRFMRVLNADAKSGMYKMAEDLYNDGVGGRHEHTQTEHGVITYDEAVEDPSVAIEFVRQQMELVRKGEKKETDNLGDIAGERRDATQIVQYLNDGADDLNNAQLDEIAELVKGSDFIAQYVSAEALRPVSMSPALAYVGRKSGTLSKNRGNALKEMPVELAIKLATGGNENALISLLANLDIEGDEGDVDYKFETVQKIMRGTIPVPSKELLDKYPHARALLYTCASAARYLSVFNHTKFHEAAYELLENIETTDKVLEDSTLYMLNRLNGHDYVLAYYMDNVGRLNMDDWFLFHTRDMAVALANRRAFRAFDKMTDGQARMFMEHIKIDQMYTLITSPHLAVKYKANVESILAFYEENPDHINSLMEGRGRDWEPVFINQLAAFSIPLLMHLADYRSKALTTLLSNTIALLSPRLLAYEGEKLEPANGDMEMVLQVIECAGQMLPKPVSIKKHFEFEDISPMDLATKYENRMQNDRNGVFNNFVKLISGMEIGEQTVDLTNNIELIMSRAPYSFYHIDAETYATHHRKFLKEISKLTSMDTVLKSIEYIMDSTEIGEVQDEDEYVNDNASIDADPDDDDYEELLEEERQNQREIVERLNQKTVERNAKMLDVMRALQTFIGEPEEDEGPGWTDDDEDEDDDEKESTPIEFGYSTPQFTPAIFEEYSSEIEELRVTVQDTLIQRFDEHEDNKERAGY